VKQQSCKECGSIYHTKMYHKPRKEIKRSPIKQTARQSHIVAGHKRVITKVKKPRKTKTPRQKAKEKAWDAFSIFIRTRDCLRFTGNPEEGMCVTCKSMKLRKELQAGHFVGGRSNAVLFNEQIVYSQCGYCNQKPPIGLGGNYAAYTLFMFDEGYTRAEIEGFLALKGTTKQYKLNDFIEIGQMYSDKLKTILTIDY